MGPFGPELLSTRTQVFSRLVRSAAVPFSSDLRPQSHPGVRSVLRSIRCRFVIVDNEGYTRIYPKWICIPLSLPFRWW